jgi:CBS domain containing-hemolysin-like protein
MTLFTAMLMLQCLRRSRPWWRRCTGAVPRAPGPHREHHVLLASTAGYALVALATGAVGMAGVADGLSLHPFLPLLALSALTLAASLLFAIAALLACMATLPELGARGPGARFR